MSFELPPLPYEHTALEPHISKETIELHYGKHTRKYFDTANELAKGTIFDRSTLDDVTREELLKMGSTLFNNVSQAWNHVFYWNGMAAEGETGEPSTKLLVAIEQQFISLDNFKQLFSDQATRLFGSGWTWLVWKEDRLQIKNTPNAGTPLTEVGAVPILVCDVWEHAYLYDEKYAANRAAYVKGWWNVVNWNTANDLFEKVAK